MLQCFQSLLPMPVKSPPSKLPSRSPYRKWDTQFPKSLLTYLSKEPFLQLPLTQTLHRERSSIWRAYFYISEFPVKSPPSRFLLTELPHKKATFPELSLTCLSKSPVKVHSSRFPRRGPYGKRCPFPQPSFTYLSESLVKELSRWKIFARDMGSPMRAEGLHKMGWELFP
jgi:hypothetical protein